MISLHRRTPGIVPRWVSECYGIKSERLTCDASGTIGRTKRSIALGPRDRGGPRIGFSLRCMYLLGGALSDDFFPWARKNLSVALDSSAMFCAAAWANQFVLYSSETKARKNIDVIFWNFLGSRRNKWPGVSCDCLPVPLIQLEV